MPSDIYRDPWGIPHLRADSVDDLARLQGRAAALDRGAQITTERLRAEGRLASVAGPDEVPWDRFARRARLDDTARRCYARLDEPTRRWVGAYVDGVNEVLGTTDPWRPWSPLGVFGVQHILFGTFPHRMWQAHVEATLGADKVELFASEGPGGSGSNAWAVAGPSPIIAGDPHRVLELPGIYHQVRLACPEFDVFGFAFPGVPGLPHFGHTGSVAWAITNAMADYQRLYPLDDTTPVASHEETIDVRGADPVTVEVIDTPLGPVIDEGVILHTPARATHRLGFEALLPLLRSRTARDVAEALRCWVEPVNSVIVADSSGTVLSLVAGLMPHSDGSPPPAATVTEAVVHANDRRAGDTDGLGNHFAPPHRAARIRTLLGEPPETIHTDDRLGGSVLLDLLARLDVEHPLRDRLLAWDRRMSAGSTDAGAYAAWRGAVARRLCDHPDLRPLFTPHRHDPIFNPWLDPRTRVGLAVDALVLALPDAEALAIAALDDVADDGGTWGSRHLLHPIGSGAVPRTELSGDTDCVLATSTVPGVSDVCWRGPVARYVWDLGDRARSRWIVPFGAAGDPASPHFHDQLERWAAGELIPLVTDWNTLRKESETMYQYAVPGLGDLRLIPVEPATHAELIHSWVTQRRATYWGMGDYTVDQVREVYAFLDSLTTHHAYLILVDGTPTGIFQTYEPDADPVGERYTVEPGDIGMHLLLAPGEKRARNFTGRVGAALCGYLFQNPAHRRVVVEPDSRNHLALRRMRMSGFTFDTEIDMPGKKAQLAFLTRDAYERVAPLQHA
ncbi:GNAT family N-acetyltransferase [Actinoplanes sp. NPDC051346]|uniref:GNAT family N-acetyltransferase n=1 Tax=Actinoplanes sp. NPDC051346 TaxID=3155048 RepID=UPI0034349708